MPINEILGQDIVNLAKNRLIQIQQERMNKFNSLNANFQEAVRELVTALEKEEQSTGIFSPKKKIGLKLLIKNINSAIQTCDAQVKKRFLSDEKSEDEIQDVEDIIVKAKGDFANIKFCVEAIIALINEPVDQLINSNEKYTNPALAPALDILQEQIELLKALTGESELPMDIDWTELCACNQLRNSTDALIQDVMKNKGLQTFLVKKIQADIEKMQEELRSINDHPEIKEEIQLKLEELKRIASGRGKEIIRNWYKITTIKRELNDLKLGLLDLHEKNIAQLAIEFTDTYLDSQDQIKSYMIDFFNGNPEKLRDLESVEDIKEQHQFVLEIMAISHEQRVRTVLSKLIQNKKFDIEAEFQKAKTLISGNDALEAKFGIRMTNIEKSILRFSALIPPVWNQESIKAFFANSKSCFSIYSIIKDLHKIQSDILELEPVSLKSIERQWQAKHNETKNGLAHFAVTLGFEIENMKLEIREIGSKYRMVQEKLGAIAKLECGKSKEAIRRTLADIEAFSVFLQPREGEELSKILILAPEKIITIERQLIAISNSLDAEIVEKIKELEKKKGEVKKNLAVLSSIPKLLTPEEQQGMQNALEEKYDVVMEHSDTLQVIADKVRHLEDLAKKKNLVNEELGKPIQIFVLRYKERIKEEIEAFEKRSPCDFQSEESSLEEENNAQLMDKYKQASYALLSVLAPNVHVDLERLKSAHEELQAARNEIRGLGYQRERLRRQVHPVSTAFQEVIDTIDQEINKMSASDLRKSKLSEINKGFKDIKKSFIDSGMDSREFINLALQSIKVELSPLQLHALTKQDPSVGHYFTNFLWSVQKFFSWLLCSCGSGPVADDEEVDSLSRPDIFLSDAEVNIREIATKTVKTLGSERFFPSYGRSRQASSEEKDSDNEMDIFSI